MRSIRQTEKMFFLMMLVTAGMFLVCSGQLIENSCIISNNYDPNAKMNGLKVERTWLYQPVKEWTYSHHPHITFFKGQYYAMWSNGRKDEDAAGQRVLISRSKDCKSWSRPVPLVDSMMGKGGVEVVLTAGGFHQHKGLLLAYFGQYEADKSGGRLLAVTTKEGINWSGIKDMGVAVIPNHGPRKTKTGRLIICGHTSFPYTDDPQGLSGWTMVGIYPTDTVMPVDSPNTIFSVQKKMEWPAVLCEGSFYGADDGSLNMMLRAVGEGYRGWLWATRSIDNGRTWSKPVETKFSDSSAKFDFGRLPDGRFYYVGNPDVTNGWRRYPLVLSLSKDGVVFGHHYIIADESYEKMREGLCKDGEYGYPDTIIDDGHLCIIVSRKKEAVEVFRIPLGDIK